MATVSRQPASRSAARVKKSGRPGRQPRQPISDAQADLLAVADRTIVLRNYHAVDSFEVLGTLPTKAEAIAFVDGWAFCRARDGEVKLASAILHELPCVYDVQS